MKFIVTQYPLGEVDVRLARETKDKIRRFGKTLYWSSVGVGTIFLVKSLASKESTEISE